MVSAAKIDRLTARITEYRLWRHIRRHHERRRLEAYVPIKWNITAKAMKARGIMDQISAEYDGFIESGSEHLADVKGLRSHVGEMQEDLQSAANVMGNASGAGGASNGAGEGAGEKKASEATKQLEAIKTNPESIVAQQSASRDVADQVSSALHYSGS